MMPKEAVSISKFEQLPILRKTLLVVLFLLTYVYAQVLPIDWSWENGPLEMAQNIVLAFSFILMMVYAWRATERELRQFWLWLSPVWLLMLGRELSWGRVFFPTHIGPEGPVFLAKDQIPFGSFINPAICLIVLVVLVTFVYCRIYQVPLGLLKEKKFPFFETTICMLAAVLGDVGEKMSHLFFGGRGQVVEELCELVVYLSLLLICVDIKWKQQPQRENSLIPKTGHDGQAPHISGSGGN